MQSRINSLAKNYCTTINIQDTGDFRVPWPKRPCPKLKYILAFLNTYQHAKKTKKTIYSIYSFLKYSFWPCQSKKFSNQNLIFLNLYEHVKCKVFSLFCSGDMIHWFKILQFDWPKAFCAISQVQHFIHVTHVIIINNILFLNMELVQEHSK